METAQFKWIDTHCHLYVREFDHDRTEMIRRALDSGVYKMMLPNIDVPSIPGMWELVEAYPGHCFPMIGLHPCSVKGDFNDMLDFMEQELVSKTYIGVGETGIDLFWDTTFRQQQIEAFERQIGWARKFRLPVIIHSRESLDLTIEVIERHHNDDLRGIFHCFSGSQEQIKRIEGLGFKVGIGGVATFKKAGLAEMLAQIPLSMMVLETDAPYLAPVPYRGKRNEPSYLVLVGQKIADVLGMPLEEVARITSSNAESVYGKKD
ncbi:MAG TPA: TatD family hydrolase [Saprospiraceae bacterium]|nr:TatD family hydrolase [Saprospiraceae bacterium]